METQSRSSQQLRWYYLFVLAAVAGYSAYFLWFTVFDGFATFSNDAGSYVLLARKWSPLFTPTAAELFTWPVHAFPPGFPWLLAVTGASESLWAGHLVVSLCMLAGLVLFGVYLGQQTGRLIAGLMLVVACLTPGVIVHSLGLLSENLYILTSLAALVVYVQIRNRSGTGWGWYLALLVFATATVLTRTVGIALIGALLLVPMLDRGLLPKQRLILSGIALLAIVLWPVLGDYDAPVVDLDYRFYVAEAFSVQASGLADLVARNLQVVHHNAIKLLSGWNHYFFLSHNNDWFFVLSYALLAAGVVGLGLRAAKLRLDAVYLLFYLGIILLWRHSEQMVRFLHPVALLMLAQPLLYLSEQGDLSIRQWGRMAVAAVLVAFSLHLAFIQMKLVELKVRAELESPRMAHQFEYYDRRFGQAWEETARWNAVLYDYMSASAEGIAEGSIVSVLKHENYAILANRKAVPLSAAVSHEQQLCNFKLKKVDVVFLSNLVGPMNSRGLGLIEKYEPVASEVRSMLTPDGITIAHLIYLDEPAIERQLRQAGFPCERYREAP